mgnify:CR=1 FL=1
MLAGDKEVQEKIKQIFITPPEVNADSDEDSADDDDGEMVYNLTGMLCSNVFLPRSTKYFLYRTPVTS